MENVSAVARMDIGSKLPSVPGNREKGNDKPSEGKSLSYCNVHKTLTVWFLDNGASSPLNRN